MSELPPGFVLDQPVDMGLPPGFVIDQPNMAADVAKSAASGLASGATGLLGMGGDVGSLVGKGVDYAGAKLGANPDTMQTIKDVLARGLRSNPITSLPASILQGPGSQDLTQKLESVTGPLHQPQTVPGQYARTLAEFLPAAIGGPESIAARLATRVAVPALTSETAGQLTKGTDAEPYARVAGALAGGVGASKVANMLAERNAVNAATPALSAVKNEASNTYDALTSRNVATPLPASALDSLASDITTTLNNRGIRPSNAGSIHAAVDELRTPATAGAADVADLVAGRQSIKELLGKVDTNKAGAGVALGKIEAAIEQASPGTMKSIREADQNWAAVKANEALDKKLARADLRAAGADSGMNVGNKVRQKVADLLLSNEARYLSSETKADLEKIVRGTASQNVMRHVANLLGGGGGLGMLASGTAGYEAGGVPGAIGAALLGRGFKMANNRSVLNQAKGVAEAIRRRSPLGQQMAGLATPSVLPPQAIAQQLPSQRILQTAAAQQSPPPTRPAPIMQTPIFATPKTAPQAPIVTKPIPALPTAAPSFPQPTAASDGQPSRPSRVGLGENVRLRKYQDWEPGRIVKVGFVDGLKVEGTTQPLYNGDARPFILTKGANVYRVTPHRGMEKLSSADGEQALKDLRQ